GQDDIRGPVAFKDAVRRLPRRHTLGLDLLARLAECQRLGLSKQIGHEQVVLVLEGTQWLKKTNEIARDELRSLMKQLIKGVLTIRTRFPPDDGTRLVVDPGGIEADALAVALHLQLLQIGRKPAKIAGIRQDGNSLRAEEIVVPDRQESHQNR